jgi:hypothetical protein
MGKKKYVIASSIVFSLLVSLFAVGQAFEKNYKGDCTGDDASTPERLSDCIMDSQKQQPFTPADNSSNVSQSGNYNFAKLATISSQLPQGISGLPAADIANLQIAIQKLDASKVCYLDEAMKKEVDDCDESYSKVFDNNGKTDDGFCSSKSQGVSLTSLTNTVAQIASAALGAQGGILSCVGAVEKSFSLIKGMNQSQSDCQKNLNTCISACSQSDYKSEFEAKVPPNPIFSPPYQERYIAGEACYKRLGKNHDSCRSEKNAANARDAQVATLNANYTSNFLDCYNALTATCTSGGGSASCAAAALLQANYNPSNLNPNSTCASGSNCNSATVSNSGFSAGGSASISPTSSNSNGPGGPFGDNGPAEAAHIPVPPADKSAAAGLALGTGSSGGGPFGGGNGGGNPGAKAAAQQGGGAAPPTPAAKLGFIGSSSSTSSSAGSGYNSTTAAAKNGERAVFGSKIAGDRSPSSESLANAEGDVFYHASKQYYNEALAKRVYSDGTVSGP